MQPTHAKRVGAECNLQSGQNATCTCQGSRDRMQPAHAPGVGTQCNLHMPWESGQNDLGFLVDNVGLSLSLIRSSTHIQNTYFDKTTAQTTSQILKIKKKQRLQLHGMFRGSDTGTAISSEAEAATQALPSQVRQRQRHSHCHRK